VTETTADSMLDVDLGDAGELETLKEGEYQLTILRADIQDSKSHNDRVNLRLCMEDASNPNIDDIYVYLPVPNSEWKAADPKSHKKGSNRFKDFIDAFSVDMPLEVSRLIGLVGWALVAEEADDRDGSMRNQVRRFVVGKK